MGLEGRVSLFATLYLVALFNRPITGKDTGRPRVTVVDSLACLPVGSELYIPCLAVRV